MYARTHLQQHVSQKTENFRGTAVIFGLEVTTKLLTLLSAFFHLYGQLVFYSLWIHGARISSNHRHAACPRLVAGILISVRLKLDLKLAMALASFFLELSVLKPRALR